eukprot:s393_g13.t1
MASSQAKSDAQEALAASADAISVKALLELQKMEQASTSLSGSLAAALCMIAGPGDSAVKVEPVGLVRASWADLRALVMKPGHIVSAFRNFSYAADGGSVRDSNVQASKRCLEAALGSAPADEGLVRTSHLNRSAMGTSEKAAEFDVVVGTPVKYFLLGEDETALRSWEEAKRSCIETTLERLDADGTLDEIASTLQTSAPILVTGSSGYLGSALIRTLRSRGIKAVGMDLVSAETTDFLGCVSDAAAVAAASEACRSIIHTAALHAPNQDFYKDADFERVNVVGTENVMRRADAQQMAGVVFSSTTSLMNTAEVKRRSAAETVVLKASVDYGTPRNIYGVTKKRAEDLGRGDLQS